MGQKEWKRKSLRGERSQSRRRGQGHKGLHYVQDLCVCKMAGWQTQYFLWHLKQSSIWPAKQQQSRLCLAVQGCGNDISSSIIYHCIALGISTAEAGVGWCTVMGQWCWDIVKPSRFILPPESVSSVSRRCFQPTEGVSSKQILFQFQNVFPEGLSRRCSQPTEGVSSPRKCH